MRILLLILSVFVVTFKSHTQGLFPFREGELWGYMDTLGNRVIEPVYPMAGFFTEGLAYAQIGDALGFINMSGEVVIEPAYAAATNFHNGFASVMVDEDWMVIDKNGDFTMETYFAKPMVFNNGLAKFKLEMGLRSKYGFVNIYGDTVIYPQYEFVSDFSEGLCMATLDGSTYGYIDINGEWVVEPSFSLGVLMKMNDEFDFSDKNFKGGYVAIEKEEKYGLMNRNGEIVVPCQFDFLGQFGEGLIPARKDDKYGYINLEGKWIIQPIYSSAELFQNGLAAVSTGPMFESKYGFINAKGEVVIPLEIAGYFSMYESMRFWEGFVPCYIEPGVFGYLNRKGKVIWKTE